MNGTAPRSRNAKSQAQIELTNKLIAELREFDNDAAEAVRQDLITKWKANQATGHYLYNSNTIMIAVIKGYRVERNTAHRDAGRPVVDPGRYAFEDAEGAVRFYLVQVDKKTGRYTVSAQAGSDYHELTNWTNALAVLREIEVDPRAAAITYGLKLGVCGRCGAELTKQSSREAGIGPICATRF